MLFLLSSLVFGDGVSSAPVIVADSVVMPLVITFSGQRMNGKMGGWTMDRGQPLFLLLRKAQGLYRWEDDFPCLGRCTFGFFDCIVTYTGLSSCCITGLCDWPFNCLVNICHCCVDRQFGGSSLFF